MNVYDELVRAQADIDKHNSLCKECAAAEKFSKDRECSIGITLWEAYSKAYWKLLKAMDD